MPAITTEQLLMVNIKEIDEQHLEIVAMINRFHDALLSSDPGRADAERKRIWATLTDTFSTHFSAEQNIMAAMGYPLLAEHTGKHRAFLDRLAQTKSDAENGFLPLNSELIKTLSAWFLAHESEEDRGYADFYRRSGNR
jgi:hemerythrin-like metal-binding protein